MNNRPPATGYRQLASSRCYSSRQVSRRVLLLVFFASGISALLYQIVWLKYLGLIFGNTVYAAATLIAIFLGGLGVGAFVFSRAFGSRPALLVYSVTVQLFG